MTLFLDIHSLDDLVPLNDDGLVAHGGHQVVAGGQ